MAVVSRCRPLIKVVRGDGLPYSLVSPRYFPKNDDYTYDDFLISRESASIMVTMIKLHVHWNLEYDLAGGRTLYSGVTKFHGRKLKSDKLDVACGKASKLKIINGAIVFKKKQNNKCKLNDI